MCLLRTRIPSYITHRPLSYTKIDTDTILSDIKFIFRFPNLPPKCPSHAKMRPTPTLLPDPQLHPLSKVRVTSLPNLKGPSLVAAGTPRGLSGLGFSPSSSAPCPLLVGDHRSSCRALGWSHLDPDVNTSCMLLPPTFTASRAVHPWHNQPTPLPPS